MKLRMTREGMASLPPLKEGQVATLRGWKVFQNGQWWLIVYITGQQKASLFHPSLWEPDEGSQT